MRLHIIMHVTIELNAAFCERHLVKCLPPEQLPKECTYVGHAQLQHLRMHITCMP